MKKGFAPILLILIVTLILVAGAYFVYSNNAYNNSSIPLSTRSANTKVEKQSERENIDLFERYTFEVNIPLNYTVEEKTNVLILKSPHGEIHVGWIGTNFDTINEHVDDTIVMNKIDGEIFSEYKIAGYDAIKWQGKYDDHVEKSISILAGSGVYYVTTKDPELYDDLDQIANSFQYTGEK